MLQNRSVPFISTLVTCPSWNHPYKSGFHFCCSTEMTSLGHQWLPIAKSNSGAGLYSFTSGWLTANLGFYHGITSTSLPPSRSVLMASGPLPANTCCFSQSQTLLIPLSCSPVETSHPRPLLPSLHTQVTCNCEFPAQISSFCWRLTYLTTYLVSLSTS